MKHTHLLTLILATVFLSLAGVFSRFLFPTSGYINTFFGYLFVLIMITFWITIKNKWKLIRLKEKKKEMIILALGQLGSAAFFMQAVMTINLAIAGLLLYSAPIWICLIYFFTKEEKLKKNIIFPLFLGILGLILLLDPSTILHQARLDFGILLGLAAGISYAISFVYMRKVKDDYETEGVMFWNYLIGCLILFPSIFFYSFTLNQEVILLFAGIGLSWTIGNFLFYYALKFVKAQYASIVTLTEPLFIALWGLLFFGEYMSLFSMIGGILILIAVYFINSQMEQ